MPHCVEHVALGPAVGGWLRRVGWGSPAMILAQAKSFDALLGGSGLCSVPYIRVANREGVHLKEHKTWRFWFRRHDIPAP